MGQMRKSGCRLQLWEEQLQKQPGREGDHSECFPQVCLCFWLVLAPSLLSSCPSPFHSLALPAFPCFSTAGELTAKPKQPYLTQSMSKPSPLVPSRCSLCLPMRPLYIHVPAHPVCMLFGLFCFTSAGHT